jgi:hypothetical protein
MGVLRINLEGYHYRGLTNGLLDWSTVLARKHARQREECDEKCHH